MLATVAWDGGGDGVSWNDAQNWNTDSLPSIEDDVTVNVAGNPTIQVTGKLTVKSLVNHETLRISGNSDGGHAVLSVMERLSNHGILRMESTDSTWKSNLTGVGDAEIANELSGRVELLAGSGGERFIRGYFINRGVIHTDSGIADVRSGVGTTARMLGLFDAAGGSIDGDLWFSGATIRMTEPQPEGTQFLFGGSDNRIEGDILPNTTVWVTGSSAFHNAALTVDKEVTNHGTIRLESRDSTWESNLVVLDDATLVNASDGSVEARLGSGGERYFSGHFINEGTIDISPSVGTTARMLGLFDAAGGSIDGDLWFSGATIRMTEPQPEGTQFLFGGSDNRIDGDILQNATVWVRGSSTFGDASLTVDKEVTNHGTIRLETITVVRDSNLVVADDRTLVNASDGLIEVNAGRGGSRHVSGNILNEGKVVLRSNTTIGSDSAQFTNRGLIQNEGVTTTFTAGTFTNAFGGIVGGTGTINTDDAVFINNGTFDLDGPAVNDGSMEATLITIGFSDAFGMDPATVTDPNAYRLQSSGGDGTFNDGNEEDLSDWISDIDFDSQSQTATLKLSGRLRHESILLTINGDDLMNNNGDALFPGEDVHIVAKPALPRRLHLLAGSADTYFQDFDEALTDDASFIGPQLPLGWVGNNNLATNETISHAFADGQVTSGTFNAGPIFGDDTDDRTLAVGNNGGDEESALEFYAKATSDIHGIRLAFDIEAWLGKPTADDPGEGAFNVTLEVSQGGLFETVVEFNNGLPVTTGATLSPNFLDGNAAENSVSFDSGGVGVFIPEGAIMRIRFDAQNAGATNGWLFGVDNMMLRTLPAGDTDGDGRIDVNDLLNILGARKFNTGQPATWSEGDFNNDGRVNTFDLVAMLSSTQGEFPKEYATAEGRRASR